VKAKDIFGLFELQLRERAHGTSFHVLVGIYTLYTSIYGSNSKQIERVFF